MTDSIPTIQRTGIMFRPGNYGAKGIYTDADLDRLAGAVNAPIKMSHFPTLLDGKLGICERAFVGFDESGGKVLMGEWQEPEPLAKLLGETPRSLSVEIERGTMQLKAVALEVNPHIKDAAFFSQQVEEAYARFSRGEDIVAFRYESETERDAIPAADFGDPEAKLFPVRTQQEYRQAMEEIGNATDPTAVKARILEIAQRKGLKIDPSPWCSSEGMSKPLDAYTMSCWTADGEEHSMKVFIPNAGGSKAGTPEEVVQFTGGTIGQDTRGLQVQDEAGAMSRATPEQIVAFTAGAVKFEIPAVAAVADDGKLAELEARLAKFEAEKTSTMVQEISDRAEVEYNALFEANKVLPADKEQVIAAFSAALIADKGADQRKDVACFAEGSPTADFSLFGCIKAEFAKRPAHSLTVEQTGGQTADQIVAFGQNETTVTDSKTGAEMTVVDAALKRQRDELLADNKKA